MTDSEGESATKQHRQGGKAKATAAMAAGPARSAETPSSPKEDLDILAQELNDEEEAIAVLRSSGLVFLSVPAVDKVRTLDPHAPSNSVVISHERTVDFLLTALSGMSVFESTEEQDRALELLDRANLLRKALDNVKLRATQDAGHRAHLASVHDKTYDNTAAFTGVPPARHGHHLSCAFVIVFVHLILGATLGLSHALLCAMDILLALVATGAARVPHDLRTALSWFPLDADFESIACCPNPECCKLHFPDNHNRLPERCDAEFGAWKCNWTVTKKYVSRGQEHFRPIRSFHCQSVTSWVGKLLARPGMEEKMEEYVDDAVSLKERKVFGDIWHTTFLRTFEWAFGTQRGDKPGFASTQRGDLRLLFSLAIDWFTAHGGKQAGKKWSIGAIYLVCHNLPLDIRFRPENVCLIGIIPGRTKPLGYAINWFLRRLVDELVPFYEFGVWFTQTCRFPRGRTVWAALGPIVCDLDAARGVAGLGSIAHTLFCSLCRAKRDQMADFETQFELRCGTPENHFQPWVDLMKLWDDATSSERIKIWKEHGIRWTEFARLRYWNPFQFLVIDPMHNLFLGLFRRHFRFIWRMDVDTSGWGDAVRLDPGQLAHAKEVFSDKDCTLNQLKALAGHALQGLAYICETFPEDVLKAKKPVLAQALLDWKKDVMSRDGQLPAEFLVDEHGKDLSNEWQLTQPKLWNKLDKLKLLGLCKAANISETEGKKVAELRSALQEWLNLHEQHSTAVFAEEGEDEPAVKPAKGKRKVTGVALGRGVLSAISKDITRTVLPDWIDRAPTHVGNTKHGKLSANHWRILCTIHCVFTLVRLWGLLKVESKRYLALENFLHLVKAVELATSRTTTHRRQKAYTVFITRYLNGLKVLYPTASITPNHHLATHLPLFLQSFGPPHTWWAFPYERYNGILQRISTNNIIGDMEKTMMRRFIQSARLKWLITDNMLPESIKPYIKWGLDLIRREYSGSLLLENDAAGIAGDWSIQPCNVKPSRAMLKMLKESNKSPAALQTAEGIQHRGMTFSSFDRLPRGSTAKLGNCIVLVKIDHKTVPARIREIAYKPQGQDDAITGEDTHILLDLYEALSPADEDKDPYRRWRLLEDYPWIECHLRYTTFTAQRLVRISDVVCHAAMCEYEADRAEHRLEKTAAVFLTLNRT